MGFFGARVAVTYPPRIVKTMRYDNASKSNGVDNTPYPMGGNTWTASKIESVTVLNTATTRNPARTDQILFNLFLFIYITVAHATRRFKDYMIKYTPVVILSNHA